MTPDELQQLVDRELKQLPSPQAPNTLLPRVLAATVGRRPAPWYARPWLAWPRRWQIASASLLVAIGAGLSIVCASAQPTPGLLTPRAPAGAAGRIEALAQIGEQGATLVRVVWQVLLQPAAFWLLVFAISLSLACAALWSALERGAMGGASQR